LASASSSFTIAMRVRSSARPPLSWIVKLRSFAPVIFQASRTEDAGNLIRLAAQADEHPHE